MFIVVFKLQPGMENCE